MVEEQGLIVVEEDVLPHVRQAEILVEDPEEHGQVE